MSDHENSRHDEIDLIRLAVTGQGQAWRGLQDRLFAIIDVIAKRVQESTPVSPTGAETSADVAKDVLRIASDWARAKVERPSLENAKIRAEIASEFAEAKRRLAEARKADAEAAKVEQEVRNSALTQDLDNLERLMRLVGLVTRVDFARLDGDGHLYIGNQPLGDADGDVASRNRSETI